MFFIVSAPFQHDKGVSYMVLHIRCDAKLYFKSIKTMVTMLNNGNYVDFTYKAAPRLIFPAQDSHSY